MGGVRILVCPHRRSIFLINREFQLRFSFYVCSWLIALGFAYPLIISNLFDYFIRYLAADPTGPTLATLERTRQELLWLLISMQIILVILTFLISVFMSHRIAGPIYKLHLQFQKVRQGRFHDKLTFRENDYFQDIITDYNEMVESVGNQIEKDRATVRDALARLEALEGSSNPVIQAELRAIIGQLQTTVVQDSPPETQNS